MAEAMRGYPSIEVDAASFNGILHGNPLNSEVQGTAVAVDPNGNLLAIGIGNGSLFQPKVVLVSEVMK
jgi:hypothetical protein